MDESRDIEGETGEFYDKDYVLGPMKKKIMIFESTPVFLRLVTRLSLVLSSGTMPVDSDPNANNAASLTDTTLKPISCRPRMDA